LSRSTAAQRASTSSLHLCRTGAVAQDRCARPKHAGARPRLVCANQGQGYRGGYSRVTDFIRAWRASPGKDARAFVPLKFELGEAFQFDWSEEGLVVGGIYHRMQVSHMKLCASRAFWLVAYPSQGHEMLFDAHTRSFARWAGWRPGHLRQHEDGRGQGQEGQGPHRQRPLCRDVRTLPVRCRLLQRRQRLGERRGGEERAGQPYRRIWIEAQHTALWSSFAELNVWLGERCRSLCGARYATPNTRQFSVAEMLEQERAN
jgi:hypothetical protein